MKVLQFLLSAALMIGSSHAAPVESEPVNALGYQGPGAYRIRNPAAGTYLEMDPRNKGLVLARPSGSPYQLFVIQEDPSNRAYTLQCRAIPDSYIAAGNYNEQVTGEPFQGDRRQLWRFGTAPGPDSVYITMLEVSAYGLAATVNRIGAPVVIFQLSGQPLQVWQLQFAGASVSQSEIGEKEQIHLEIHIEY